MFKEFNILRLFFEESTREFNVREVARIVKVAPATASKELEKFERRGLLVKRRERILILYQANRENDLYRDCKVFYNIRKVKDSGLIDKLNRFYLRPTIILFGSFASGMDTETSDIDLLVISEKVQDFAEMGWFKKKLKRNIQLFIVKHVKDLKNKHLINNVLNGMVVQGKVQWI